VATDRALAMSPATVCPLQANSFTRHPHSSFVSFVPFVRFVVRPSSSVIPLRGFPVISVRCRDYCGNANANSEFPAAIATYCRPLTA
jgi:hypothetical protein